MPRSYLKQIPQKIYLAEGKARGGEIAQRTIVREHIYPTRQRSHLRDLLLSGIDNKKGGHGQEFSVSSFTLYVIA